MNKLKSSIVRRILWGLAAMITITPFALAVAPGAASADSFTAGSCTNVQLKVALAPAQPKDQTVSGTLCTPFTWAGQHEVDVLVHGGSYDRTYWRFPIKTALYSYVDDTLLTGRATFAYDKIGVGQSSHLLSTAITNDGQIFVLHQVLDWLHGKHTYAKVATVGHSSGSITVLGESATFHDEDKIVLTGLSHNISPAGVATSAAAQYPANQDPEFSGQSLDNGWLTTRPGQRNIFYSNFANPDIIKYDEAHKAIFSATEFGAGVAQTLAPAGTNIAKNVTTPVLIALGQDDLLFCGSDSPQPNCTSEDAIKTLEQAYFLHAPSITVQVTPFTGHDLALHPTSPLSFLRINKWLQTH